MEGELAGTLFLPMEVLSIPDVTCISGEEDPNGVHDGGELPFLLLWYSLPNPDVPSGPFGCRTAEIPRLISIKLNISVFGCIYIPKYFDLNEFVNHPLCYSVWE